jgi:tetratricopeptide (TPR) repeat protein
MLAARRLIRALDCLSLMSANIPTVRRIAWSYTIPHLLLMLGLILLLWKVQFPDKLDLALLYGALVYLGYSFGSKAVLLKHHRRGINLSKLGLFREAIPEFQSSYSFLNKYPWIDKYRFITMLDSSAISYREMALCNIAYSYIQLEEKGRAQEYYRKALVEFPESHMAKSGLEYVESGEGK